jgi:hypothetical protein
MSLAAELAAIICTGEIPVPGMVHDPSQPLVLGNQPGLNYTVITHDEVAHQCKIQVVNGSTVSIMTFGADGQLLINGKTIAELPELAALVTAASASATASEASRIASDASAVSASASSSTAASAANTAVTNSNLSQQFAQAPDGTVLPGGGKSAFANAEDAEEIAVESRDLDVSDPISGDEVFQSGFLFTEQVRNPSTLMTVTIPPGIYNSPDKRKRWASYRLAPGAAGSIKFAPQPGGTDLVTPQVKARGRVFARYVNADNSTRRTLTATVGIPAVTNGEIIFAFHGIHSGSTTVTSINFSTVGTLVPVWSELVPYPANASAQFIPDWNVRRAPLVGVAAQSIDLVFDEGVNVGLQCVDWWVIEGTSGSTPLWGKETRTPTNNRNNNVATLAALPAQSLVLCSAAQGAGTGTSGYASFSANLARVNSGNSYGAPDVAASDASAMRNEVWATADGLATAAGDFVGQVNWTGSLKGNIILIGYHPKSVVGGGTVVLNKQGSPARDTIVEPNGVAELWFENDGKTVDVRVPKT